MDIRSGFLTAAPALSGLSGIFASQVKEGKVDPTLIDPIRDTIGVLGTVARAFAKESAERGKEPRVGLRLKHISEDLDQLADRLTDLQEALEILTESVIDDPDAHRVFVLGLRTAILATIAFAQQDLLITGRRLPALAEYYQAEEPLEEEGNWALEEALAHYDTDFRDVVLHMDGPPRWRPVSTSPDEQDGRAVQCRLLPVMFATDRVKVTGCSSLHVDYQDGRGHGPLAYGVAEVSIPRGTRHRRGRLERPSLWKLQFREDPQRHIAILTCEEKDLDTWQLIASERMAAAGTNAALVFIHGFNVSF